MHETLANRKITLTGTAEFCDVLEANESWTGRRFALLVFCDSEAQAHLMERATPVVIGREPPCEIVVRDPSVSRQHARFRLEDDVVWVDDLESRNGTVLERRRITSERLEAGDEVKIGNARVIVAATRAPAAAGLEPAVRSKGDVVIESLLMQRLYQQAEQAALGTQPVLILGETGSGKELVAAAIHRAGARKDEPFVAINCAAIPPTLLESAFFGHERGAFTGAAGRSLGIFERANGGVLFLDEIGELPAAAQAALLRAVETKKICRIGSATEINVDVRIIAATHCDLKAMIEEGSFRRDLYYRLGAVELEVPPLRARPEEIAPLARFFLAKVREEWELEPQTIAADAMQVLERYSWPGNMRQLRHAVERASLLATNGIIEVGDLPDVLFATKTLPPASSAEALPTASSGLGLRELVQRYERAVIDDALRRTGNNRQLAAKLLRIPRRTLFRKLRALKTEELDPASGEEKAERPSVRAADGAEG